MKQISKEHMELLDDLFPRPEVRKEIKRRVLNGSTFICCHGKRVPLKSECRKCDRGLHELVSLRQGAGLAERLMYAYMKRAAELGDPMARRHYARMKDGDPYRKPKTEQKKRRNEHN